MQKNLFLKKIFSSGAVLPRGKNLPISGKAAPGASVSVSLGDNHTVTTADDAGNFTAVLPPMTIGGPYTLSVTSGAENFAADDIFVGEVFYCSGQSNMELRLNKQSPAPCECDYKNPNIKIFTVPRHLSVAGTDDVDTAWITAADTENWSNISAVGFYLALNCAKAVPGMKVGIIDNSVGGSCIAAWIDRDTLATLPVYSDRLAQYENNPPPPPPRNPDGSIKSDEILNNAILAKVTCDTPDTSLEAVDCDDSNWTEMKLPGEWSLAGIHTTGICCLRKHFTLPENWKGKDLLLSLGGIDQQDVTFVNGTEVGRTGSGTDSGFWNACRKYRVPANILNSGTNLITIRAISKFYMLQAGGFSGPADAMYLTLADDENAEKIPLNTVWKIKQERKFSITGWELQCSGEGMGHSLHILYDNMVRPIAGYPLTAVVWYQGEADSTCPEMAEQYPMMLRALRSSWRKTWGEADLPFYFVQLPGFMEEADYEEHALWAWTRNAQLQAALEEDSYPAVTSALGMAWEIHPSDKSEVGKRLAALFLNKSGAAAHGPKVEKFSSASNGVTVHFSACGDGLKLRCGKKLLQWAVAGDDKIFHPAEAVISSNDTVTVSSSEVGAISYIAYGFSTNPVRANLVNSNGFPAAPFRIKIETMELI